MCPIMWAGTLKPTIISIKTNNNNDVKNKHQLQYRTTYYAIPTIICRVYCRHRCGRNCNKYAILNCARCYFSPVQENVAAKRT